MGTKKSLSPVPSPNGIDFQDKYDEGVKDGYKSCRQDCMVILMDAYKKIKEGLKEE